ncbi:NADH-quinone oxidoreductase subunit M [bacterium]|nr:NADH-quinone oxidoreductase subunit M [bacterium]
MFDLLSLVVFFPLLGVIFMFFIPKENYQVLRNSTLFVTILHFIFTLVLLFMFQEGNPYYQFEINKAWIPSLGISYHIAIDGISLFLVVMTSFLMPIVILSSYKAVTSKVKEYMIFMLILETAMIGALVSLDFILFYLFWEMMLIPMYFLIGIFGGNDRVYATVKFFIYTMAGSVFMLVAIFYLYFASGGVSFDLTYILSNFEGSSTVQGVLFLAFFVAFAIKVPMFPFHTWLPDAHVQAPTGGSVILAGVLLKMGTYGFIRFAIPLFPDVAYKYAFWIALLAVIGIVYGALVALVQKDVKKLVAYSSVSHLGFVVLGIFAFTTTSVTGSIYQMLNHGVSTGALFLLVGILYERRHTKQIADFGGLSSVIPKFAIFFMLALLSSIALPLTNGFVGEFLILSGSFSSSWLKNGQLLTIIATSGVILGAGYMLWMYQRVMFGPIRHEENKKIKDLSLREFIYLFPLMALVFVMGIFPNFFLKKIEPSVNYYLSSFYEKNGKSNRADLAQARVNSTNLKNSKFNGVVE